MTWCLGMEVVQRETSIIVNQNQYVKQKLEEFKKVLDDKTKRSSPLDPNFQILLLEGENSEDYESDFPYREIVGSLSYAATGTRPDIATSVSVVRR